MKRSLEKCSNFNLKNGEFSLPQLIWVITDRCPHICPFCFQPKQGQDFPSKQIDYVVNIISVLNTHKVDISGGEPLLYDHIKYLCTSLHERGVSITITTMGGNHPQKKWLISNHKLFSRILISVNSGILQTHDSLTGHTGSWEKAIDLVKSLKYQNCNKVRINTVITNLILSSHEIIKIVELVAKLKPYEWCLIEPNPDNTGPTFNKFAITYDQFIVVGQEIKEQLINLNSKVNLITRTVDEYSSYWVLNPNGELFKHSKRQNQIVSRFSIFSATLENLKSKLRSSCEKK